MARLNQVDLSNLHSLLLETHRAQTKEELVELVVYHAPSVLNIQYTVWHDRMKGCGLDAEKVMAQPSYKKAIIENLESINTHLGSHPIITGLGLELELVIPKEIVTTCDFASMREIRDTAIYYEAYRHLEIENHAVVEFFDSNGEGAMICMNGQKEYTQEQVLMMQMLRDHVELAYHKLTKTSDLEESLIAKGGMANGASLTKREKEVLPLLVNAKSNIEIGIILGISSRTVEKHVASLLDKAGYENRKMLIKDLHS